MVTGLKRKQHALKGQKLLAQGSTLGTIAINKTPCKGKSFKYTTPLPSQGDCSVHVTTQGDALG